jgi:glucose/arabinose dehydrogenase
MTVAAASAQSSLTRKLVASGMTRPVFVTHAPGDYDRLFILQKQGIIRVVENGVLLVTPFMNIDASVGGGTTDNDERGLLGLAFHPDYQSNGLFYVFYTNNSNNTNVFEYSVTANPNVADAGSGERVLVITQPQTNHNGGWIGFGPDGYLYIASGDGGGAGDDDAGHTAGVGNGQDATNLLGCVLRVDVDGDDFPALPNTNYAIPSDNPFVADPNEPNDPRADEIWAFGLRNPWRCAFDRDTDDFWIADVGQGAWEEINFQDATSTGGENYGWRCREGAHNFNTGGDCSQTPFTEPVQEYSHGAGRCSISGGYVYRGCSMPDFYGKYFYGDYCTGEIWSMRSTGGAATDVVNHDSDIGLAGFTLVGFGEDALGELYVCDQAGGSVYRIQSGDGIVGGDCNSNGVDDACDLAAGAPDLNGNGMLDECECLGDVNGDMMTNITDLGTLLANFGLTPADLIDGDLNNDDIVNITDLGILLADFGCSMP